MGVTLSHQLTGWAKTCCTFLPARRYANAGNSYGPVSVCLCLYVRHNRCSIKTAGRIDLIFGKEASLCVIRKFSPRYLQNKGIFLWNFFLNSRLRKFRHSISIVEMCYQLSSRKAEVQSVINWTVV